MSVQARDVFKRRIDLSDETVVRLIDLAYAAGEGDGRWEDFLLGLADALGGGATVLMHHDLESAGAVAVAVRNDPEAARLYNDYYASIDPRAVSPKAAAVVRAGCVATDEALIEFSEFKKTEFYWDLARRFDMARLVTLPLTPGQRTFSGVSITRSERQGPFGPDAIALLEALAPHLRRALRIRRLIAGAQGDRDAVLRSIDGLGWAVIGLGSDGTVRFMNRAAGTIVERRDGLSVENGQLRASSPAETSRLRAALAKVLRRSGVAASTDSGAILIARMGGAASYQVSISAVGHRPDALFPPVGVAAVLIVRDPDTDGVVDAEALRALFGFTAAEARFAAALADGQTPAEIAERHRLTRATARWFTEQVRLKTGASTQAQAVGEMLRSPGRRRS